MDIQLWYQMLDSYFVKLFLFITFLGWCSYLSIFVSFPPLVILKIFQNH